MFHVVDFVHLFTQLDGVVLTPKIRHTITWRWTDSGEYSAKSAYLAEFTSATSRPYAVHLETRGTAKMQNLCMAPYSAPVANVGCPSSQTYAELPLVFALHQSTGDTKPYIHNLCLLQKNLDLNGFLGTKQ